MMFCFENRRFFYFWLFKIAYNENYNNVYGVSYAPRGL